MSLNKISIYKQVKSNLPKKGKLELSPQQLERIKSVSKVALGLIAVAGVVTIAAIAPNLFMAVDKIFLKKGKKLNRRQKEEKIIKTFYYLKKSGLVKIKHQGKSMQVLLTKLGLEKSKALQIDACYIPKPARWDGKWWLVAADIPTKQYRRGADLLRQKLKDMGFYSLQRTLWVYPFNPSKEIEFIAETYGIARFLTVIEVSRLDRQDEAILKEFFRQV